jgi:hypothetical protein
MLGEGFAFFRWVATRRGIAAKTIRIAKEGGRRWANDGLLYEWNKPNYLRGGYDLQPSMTEDL